MHLWHFGSPNAVDNAIELEAPSSHVLAWAHKIGIISRLWETLDVSAKMLEFLEMYPV